jgi:hypothetical protein
MSEHYFDGGHHHHLLHRGEKKPLKAIYNIR